MAYSFDLFGWYCGEGAGARTTEIAPENTNLTETPGESRANWTGLKWINLPYIPPTPIESIPGDCVITKLAFLRRFTLPERMAIRASTDPVVQDFMYMLELAGDVTLDDPDSIAGVGYLEQQSLIGAGRAAEILAC